MEDKVYFKVGKYTAVKLVGSGSTSKVYLDKNGYAIKRIKLKHIKHGRLFFNKEIDIIKQLDHPNIIKLIDYIEDEKRSIAYLIFEYCPRGDLGEFLKGRPLKEKHVKRIMKELASGLRYLLSKNIFHRDLKPKNILMMDDKSIKITDFGLAKKTNPSDLSETICGSPLYMAPEIMKKNKYCIKSDLWSIGIMLYEMVTGNVPFMASNHYQLVMKVSKDDVEIPDYLNISDECRDLIYRLLQKDPEIRIGWTEFFDHPFITDGRVEEVFVPTNSVEDWRDSVLANMRVSDLVGFEIDDIDEAEIDRIEEEGELDRIDEEDTGEQVQEETRYHSATESIAIPTKKKKDDDMYISPNCMYGVSPMFHDKVEDDFVVLQSPLSRNSYMNQAATASGKSRIRDYLDYSVYVFKKFGGN